MSATHDPMQIDLRHATFDGFLTAVFDHRPPRDAEGVTFDER